jgi:hypothetical protein
MNSSPVIFSLCFSETYTPHNSNRIWDNKLVGVGYLIDVCVAIVDVKCRLDLGLSEECVRVDSKGF